MTNTATLVMIHGLVGSLEYFDPDSRISTATVQACDLLGYGTFRDSEPARLTLGSQVVHVAAFIKDLACGRVWLLGHSMGGAIAMLAADRHPDLVCGIINVEGNFTLKDAFWSRKIVEQTSEEWAREYRKMQSDVPAFLVQCGVTTSPQRVEWMRRILAHQPASTVRAMSRAIMDETQPPEYLEAVRRVVSSGIPIGLIAGERSASAWDVPDFVRQAAASDKTMSNTGHLMMLEQPDDFCRVVASILSSSRHA